MEINEAGFRFYYDQPIEKRLDLSIEYNFHIHTSEKHPHLIHHKLTPVLLSGKGDIWLALCTVSLSPEKNIGDVVISDHTCTDHYIYSFEGRRWRKQPELILSSKEKYKKSSELVLDFVEKANVQITTRQYLNISPITELENFNNVVGIFFLATPDMLSGLASWTFYDNNSDDAITAKFGSGCSSIFSEATLENSKNGKRTFIGLFDPSVRRYIHENILSFTIPMSRFREMYYTIQDSCLSNTPAWGKIRERICRE
ncbi:DUF169 domain-containing protein [Phocaeicola vulgatus]|nr:DUF169 domain-containing protein [Phocaeicola vulgatus]